MKPSLVDIPTKVSSVKRVSICLTKPLTGVDLLKLMNPLMRTELELNDMKFLLSRVPDAYKDAVDRIFKNYVFKFKTFLMPSDKFIANYDAQLTGSEGHGAQDPVTPSASADTKEPENKSPERTYSEIYSRRNSVQRRIQEKDIRLLQQIQIKQKQLKEVNPARSSERSLSPILSKSPSFNQINRRRQRLIDIRKNHLRQAG